MFVVVRQSCIYADPECCMGEEDFKYYLTSNWHIVGLFETEELAKKSILEDAKNWILNDASDSKEEIERQTQHEIDWHYFIEECKVN